MTDREILDKIKNPETRLFGFNQLVRTYQEKVYNLVRKMVISHEDADDITQEVFIKVWKNILKFRHDAQLFTWIYRIAANLCFTHLKKRKKWFFIPIKDLENELISTLANSDLIDADEIQSRLHRAILKLPAKQRLVFQLKYFNGLKYEEIAGITKGSVGSLKASYHHAVKKIEKILGDD